jgi:hypothetical protein
MKLRTLKGKLLNKVVNGAKLKRLLEKKKKKKLNGENPCGVIEWESI